MSSIASQIEALKEEKRAYEAAGKSERSAQVDSEIDRLSDLLEDEVPDEAVHVDVGLIVAERELRALRIEAESYRSEKPARATQVDEQIRLLLKAWPVLDEPKAKRPKAGEAEAAVSTAHEAAIPPPAKRR